MARLGELLKAAREKKGLSLREAEEATKIRLQYLAALENEAYDQLPGRVYVIGFLRSYARFLGLDADKIVQEFKDQNPEPYQMEAELPSEKSKNFPLIPAAVGIVIVLVIIFSLAIALSRPSSPENPNTTVQDRQLEGREQVSRPQETDGVSLLPPLEGRQEEAGEEQETAKGVNVSVLVKEDRCWLDVKIDGRRDFRGILEAGESMEFEGEQYITIVFGNAGVVEVVYNGEKLDKLGRKKQRVVKHFGAQD
ncbi:helix-turn-helix domain-containing protein [Calderihabitans maritimus]|uniref:XRE family transcriptional regulator n=1 Tax=Calderihabitans maritimus TaxID=1246530 RepID=A0A1Z5HQF9_9FIRM|nr:helix-turn-helix domain-containing protein [Calderihabitans maritimus]GAW91545.1 XRE family transcriptional regulator [Calderihabitans maritimus]